MDNNILREDPFNALEPQNGWTRYTLGSTSPPANTFFASFHLEVTPVATQKSWWDNAILEGSFSQIPVVEILYNQLGYETYAPKKFVVRTNWNAEEAKYSIVTLQGEHLGAGDLTWGIRFKGGGDVEWPGYYWRGDFSELYEKELVRIGVELDGVQVFSPVFEIGWHAVWDRTVPLAINALQRSQCLQEPHAAWGPQEGTGEERTSEFFWELSQTRRVCAWRFEKIDLDKNGEEDLLQLLLPVATTLVDAIQEDGSLNQETITRVCSPNTQTPALSTDPILSGMGLARYALQMEEKNQGHVDAAVHAMEWCQENTPENPLLFSLAVDLFLLTEDPLYKDMAHTLLPDFTFDGVVQQYAEDSPERARAGDLIESIIMYETHCTDTPISFIMSVEMAKVAEALVRQAKNPFGVFMYSEDDKLNCFKIASPEEQSPNHTRHILEAATFVAQVYRFQPKLEYYAFVMDQINWLMGCNPYGICMLSELGVRKAPKYNLPNGAMPGTFIRGLLPHGPVAQGPGDDRPQFSLEPFAHQADLTNTVALINTMAHIKRMPVGPDDK
jgi:hypothetical protein